MEVKWISFIGDDGWYFVGFEIFDVENIDFEFWFRMVDQCVE